MKDYLKVLQPFFGLTNVYEGVSSFTEFNPDKLNRNHKVIPKNHKKFIIEGVEIYALSEKRAKEKYKKLQIDKTQED